MVCTWRSEDGSVGQFSPSLLCGLCQLDSGLQICVKTLYSLGHPIGPYILNLLTCVCMPELYVPVHMDVSVGMSAYVCAWSRRGP